MENVTPNPVAFKKLNNNYLKQKNNIDSEDAGVGFVEDDAILMMNNNFFNDDIYNYKDTFLSGRSINKSNSNEGVYDPSKSNNTSNSTKNYAYEDEDYDLNEDDYDDNNDFRTGPLALNKSINGRGGNHAVQMTNFVDLGDNMESLKFEDTLGDEENFSEHNQQHGEYFDKIYEDEETGTDAQMMDTFFKRVDSLELVKPKKAKVIKGYLIGELLGDGSYGKVKECLDMNSLARRAVKIINLKMVARKIPRGVENVRKEISIMRRLNHKNVIKLYDTFEKGNIANISNKKSPSNGATKEDGVKGAGGSGEELLLQSAAMVNLEKPPKIYIFMDYCMTNLEKLLKNAPDQRLRNWQANFYFRQLIDGLEYLHSLNIIHNDIKPGNLLITCDDVLKLCDFSISAKLSIFCEEDYRQVLSKRNDNLDDDEVNYNDRDVINPNLLTNSSSQRFPIIQCTPMFQCPEMLDEDIDELLILRNATKVDVWSSGITLYQLTTGELPFEGKNIHQIFESIRSASSIIKIPTFIDKNLSKVLLGMLDKNPITRWNLKQIRDSEWFKKKHPIIKEDLARLPTDVIQNECGSTFRMINFLEKYCESLNESHNNTQATAVQVNQSNYDNSEHENFQEINSLNPSNRCFVLNQETDPSQETHSLKNNNISNKTQNGTTLSSHQSSNIYSQAAKIKKNHCALM